MPEGIVVRGKARWAGACSLCLREISSDRDVAVDGELFETASRRRRDLPAAGHAIDLEPLVRDALLLELPLAPACASDWRPTLPGPGGHDDDDASRSIPVGRRSPSSSSDDRLQPTRRAITLQEHSMAVPKRKTPSSEDAPAPPVQLLCRASRSLCPNCGAVKHPHIVCSNCGYYRGRQVIDVD